MTLKFVQEGDTESVFSSVMRLTVLLRAEMHLVLRVEAV